MKTAILIALATTCAGALVVWSLTTRKRVHKRYARTTADGRVFAEWVERNAISAPPARPVEGGLFAQRVDREELVRRAEARARALGQ